jgi:protein gp37
MQETGIIWTNVTWNPVSGCKQVSPGCAFCYAKTLAEKYRGTIAFPNGFDLTIRPHKLREPYRLKKPSLVFVNSMSDLFWDEIPDDYRDEIVNVIEATPQHEYQVLTKRPDLMLKYSKRRKLPHNFWAGVSIEAQTQADRIDTLRLVDASIRFVSAEPLLGPLRLKWRKIHWCITGGESGYHLYQNPRLRERRGLVIYDELTKRWHPRPDRIDWVRQIRDDCLRAGVKFLHKQWGGLNPHSAGRKLDGRTWDQFPRLPKAR